MAPVYYKSARGSPVDLVWNDVPIKVTVQKASQQAYEERSLAGALKTLGLKRAVLVSPHASVVLPKRSEGIGAVPWNFWS